MITKNQGFGLLIDLSPKTKIYFLQTFREDTSVDFRDLVKYEIAGITVRLQTASRIFGIVG